MKRFSIKSMLFLGVSLLVFSCNKNENPEPDNGADNNAIALTIVGERMYLTEFNTEDGTYTNGDAFEHDQSAAFWVNGNTILVTEGYQGQKVTKYTRDNSTGKLSKSGEMQTPEGSSPYNICFNGSDKAYVSLPYMNMIWEFDVKTMTKTAEIDFNSYIEQIGQDQYVYPQPLSSIIRDGKLFVCLGYRITLQTALNKGYLAVINTSTNEIEKVISDDRVTSLGEPSDNTVLFIDEKNDLYVYSPGMFGYQPDANEGLLRIKSGQTDFDPDYFFSIKNTSVPDVPGNMGLMMYFMEYISNGELYGTISIPGLLSTPPDYTKDKNFQPFKINIYNKTLTKVDLDPTIGWSAHVHKYGNKILWGLNTKNGMGIYTTDLNGVVTQNETWVNAPGAIFDFLVFD
jgi:hypothetical protein